MQPRIRGYPESVKRVDSAGGPCGGLPTAGRKKYSDHKDFAIHGPCRDLTNKPLWMMGSGAVCRPVAQKAAFANDRMSTSPMPVGNAGQCFVSANK